MPEAEAADRVCPYLRGRQQPEPLLSPSDNNHCVLAASIHLPGSQQSRYCLGGNYHACSRFVRQQERPLPSYVMGIPPAPPPPGPEVPPLSTLIWRRWWFRKLVMYLLIVLFLALVVLGWNWRRATIQPRITPRPPLPTTLPLPTLEATSLFDQPPLGPAPR